MSPKKPHPLLRFLVLGLLFGVLAHPALAETDSGWAEEATTEGREKSEPPEDSRFMAARLGYRFVAPVDATAAAAPYDRLRSGIAGGATAGIFGPELKMLATADALHGDDYSAELLLDYAALYRLRIRSAAQWHNLLTEQLPPATASYDTQDLDPGTRYGVRTAITQADGRIKLGNKPYHLNLGYWELNRKGHEQTRFSDYYEGGTATTNTLYSRTARVDRVTREGRIGMDGHLGLLSMEYGFRIRDFSNEAPDNRYQFTNTANGALMPGSQAFNVIPDSRVTSHTFKLFSDLSGGLTGSAAYTLTQRENNAGGGDARPSNRPSDTIHAVAGDVSYTPFRELSFALKYRRLEIDRTAPATVTYPFSLIQATGAQTATPGLLPVRPASDTVRDTLILSGIYRPSHKAIYRFEYRGVLESRDNLAVPLSSANPAPPHSDTRQTHTGTAAFTWHPHNGIRLHASYSYAACDNPAFAASFSERHSGKLSVTYAKRGRWGITGSYLAGHERGEGSEYGSAVATGSRYRLPRESSSNSANVSAWSSPMEGLTVTTSYAFLESAADQTLLLSGQTPGLPAATIYRSTAHVYGINALYAATEQLDLSLAFQQVRSAARFKVPENTGIAPAAMDTTETSLSARTEWRFGKHVGSALDYAFRHYDSGDRSYDGAVHATMLSLTARW